MHMDGKMKNRDGTELAPPYEENGRWMAEDGWGCVLDFGTEEEALDFQRSLDGSESVVLFED